MKWDKGVVTTIGVAFMGSLLLGVDVAAGAQDAVMEHALEKNILEALYQSTNGESWTRQKGWMSDPVHHCEWEGITCMDPEASYGRKNRNLQSSSGGAEDQRSIEVIDLAQNNLKGSAPLSLLLLLPNIRTIRLNGNNVDYSKYVDQEQDVLGQALNLDQPIPSNIRHLDVSHTTVKSLEALFHSGDGTTQIVTPHLTDFHASQASIRGAFPPFIFDVTTLERLSLDHNSLTGPLPVTIGNCDKIKYISLAGNSLEGPIPEEFNRLSRVRYVLLEANHFTGTIPRGLTSTEYTPLLEQLDLSDQRDISKYPTPTSTSGLSGNLPAFDTHKNLRRLDLGVNSLGGSVPENFLQATEVDYFDFATLTSNAITGSVPSNVVQRLSADRFTISDNRITDVTESSCRDMEYGCNTFMCRPGTFEPRAGRQDSDFRPCLTCPQNTLYWGQTKCELSDGNPPPPPAPTEAPAPGPGHSGLTEKEILVDLFQKTGGASGQWTKSDGWGTDSNICTWYGVTCSETDQSVVGLTLDANNMASSTPSSLFDLPNLKYLYFENNDDLVVTLVGIERASKIETLDLSNTKLGENGLVGLGGASSTLQELYLNNVHGLEDAAIPTVLLTLRELRQLTVDYNDISGSLPNDLGNLNQLVVFSAVNNAITGPIPDSITSLTNLATFRISTNYMSGTLPPGLQTLSGLTVLDLSNQWSNGEDDDFDTMGNSGFVGTLPSFKNFRELRRLDLGVNSFKGTIPEDFLANVDRSDGGLFEYADISENYLTGTVPAEIASLKHIELYENQFTGIDQLVCDSQSADQLKYGCDGILCKPGYFNEKDGRQTSDNSKCEKCPDGDNIDHPYFGATDCDAQDLPFGGPAPTPPAEDFNENESVREALETIYTFCGGASWTMSSGWMDPTRKYCSWDGIRCSIEGDVIGITLRSNGLSGKFPTKTVMESISTLQSLDLDGNKIVFDFDGIESAQKLEILDLSHTDLEFIEGVGSAPALKNLYLSSNNLRGPFPTDLLQLNNLSRLSLDFNALTGMIPDQISSLKNLQFLALHDNKFSGNIPDQLDQLNGLFFLLLQANSLTGPIPDTFGSLKNLRYLDLSSQTGSGGMGLTGNLPSFTTLANLKRLDLNSNSLEGPIPDDFLRDTQVDGFEHLDLSKNKLTGKVPSVLKKFQVALYDVTDNQITGIEDALCDTSLGGAVAAYGCDAVLCPVGKYNRLGRQLDQESCKDCPENSFFGATSCGDQVTSLSPTATPDPNFDQKAILSTFYDALNGDGWTEKDKWKDASVSACEWYGITCDDDGNVESIALSGNNMAGTIPKSTFQLPFLKSLILDLNDGLKFSFDGIESARRLRVIDVSSTDTKSVTGIEKAKALKEFHSVANALRGSFPSELFAIDSLERIAIGFNEISGGLSSEIGQLTNLKLLSCESNYMSGTIPETLWGLTKLHTLRLGRNTFTGEISDSISQLSDLSIVDLSHQTENNGRGLSGSVPAFDTMNKISEIDLSSNVLTGEIPSNFLQAASPDVVDFIDLSSNKISGVVPSLLGRFDDVKIHDNEFTGVSLSLCAASRGDVYAKYHCDAVLCPPATYNSRGRQESDTGHCRGCPEALFYGSTVCPESIPDPGVSSDREILTYFYRKCGGDDWDNPDGWIEDGVSICDWYGIKCVEGEDDAVEAIDLGANNVVGIPPQALFFLPHLKHLSLYSNPLDGFSFNGISQAKKLEELILDATGVTSLIGVGQAPGLKKLNARFNGIKGSFPDDIKKLTTLQDLMISYNDFTGALPRFLEDMTNLRSLLITSNYFSGRLEGVNMPGSMRFLDISDNDLTGSIPESFLTLVPFSAAVEVDFSDNLLTGHIPSDLVRFDHLNLYLANNKITGIDEELCRKQYWNDGDVGKYGCDGLLCPDGTYSTNGRQKDDDSPCKPCELGSGKLPYMGLDVCENSSAPNRGVPFLASVVASISFLLLSL